MMSRNLFIKAATSLFVLASTWGITSIMLPQAAMAFGCTISSVPASWNMGSIYAGDTAVAGMQPNINCTRTNIFDSVRKVALCGSISQPAADLEGGSTRLLRGQGSAAGYKIPYYFTNYGGSVIGSVTPTTFGNTHSYSITFDTSSTTSAGDNPQFRTYISRGYIAPAGVYRSTVQVYVAYKGGTANASLVCTGGSTMISASVPVTVTLLPKCDVTAEDIDFGGYTSLDEILVARGNVIVNCTLFQTAKVTLSSSSSDPTRRKMTSGSGDTIEYGLYMDAGMTAPWDPNISYETEGTGLNEIIPVYAKVPAQDTPGTGQYEDLVTVTVIY